jgi:hypothetical protein
LHSPVPRSFSGNAPALKTTVDQHFINIARKPGVMAGESCVSEAIALGIIEPINRFFNLEVEFVNATVIASVVK